MRALRSWRGSAVTSRVLKVAASKSETLACGVTAIGAVAVADGWRTALLAVIAAGAVAATRIRFAGLLATSVLITVAVLAVLDAGPERSARPVHTAVAALQAHRNPEDADGA